MQEKEPTTYQRIMSRELSQVRIYFSVLTADPNQLIVEIKRQDNNMISQCDWIGHASCINARKFGVVAPMRKVTKGGGVFAPHFSGKNSNHHHPVTDFLPATVKTHAPVLQQTRVPVFEVFDADHNLFSASSDWWETLGVPRSLPIKQWTHRHSRRTACACICTIPPLSHYPAPLALH